MMNHILTLHQAVSALIEGKIGVIPTDTVYGVVAQATNPDAVTRLYTLKHREHKPGTIIAASIEQLHALGISYEDLSRVSQWWPNPLSAVLPIYGNDFLHQGVGSLAVRVIADPILSDVLKQTGPLLTSSANLPRHPEATTIQQAYDYFGTAIDFYVEGGKMSDRTSSTIIRPRADGTIEVLRQGSIHL